MIDGASAADMIGWGAGGLAFLAGGINLLWRITSKTRLAGAMDSGTIDLLTVMRQENALLRERVDLAYKERNEAVEKSRAVAEELGQLRAECSFLRTQIALMTSDLDAYKMKLAEMMNGTKGAA